MSNAGDHFRRGKLQVARSIIEDLSRVYSESEFAVEFHTAWYALNRADAALDAHTSRSKQGDVCPHCWQGTVMLDDTHTCACPSCNGTGKRDRKSKNAAKGATNEK